MDIKQESCFPDFCPENETGYYIKDLVKNIKIEKSDSDTKPQLEEGSTCKPELEEGSTCKPELEEGSTCKPELEEGSTCKPELELKQSEIETKIDIKEEHWWLQRTSWDHDIKDGTHEDIYSTKPLSVYKEGASIYTSDLSSSEDLGNDINFNMKKDGPECESGSKYQSQKSVMVDTSSVQASVCSETCDNGKIVSRASSSEQSKLPQQNNTNKQGMNKKNLSHEYRKSYKPNVSEKCSKYPSHIEKNRLTLDSKKVNKRNLGMNHLSSLKTLKLNDKKKKIHKCFICNKPFTSLSDLKEHKPIHKGTKPQKCDLCNTTFTQPTLFERHKLMHENHRPYKCKICDMAFPVFSLLDIHKEIHEG